MTANEPKGASQSKYDLEKTEPGFDRLPDMDPHRPAATDMIDEAVGKGMDKLRDDFTGKNNTKDVEAQQR
ncbi:hypothetical protein ACE3NQ_04800 [Paenibacillus terreus]|uniref:Uncharacterized protein n=1 Tax=Paenibacillus terreus TaxID=1387834 RepID=A0ABV5B3I0_9BACL